MYFHMFNVHFQYFMSNFLDHRPKVHIDCQKGTLLLYDLKYTVHHVQERHLHIPL